MNRAFLVLMMFAGSVAHAQRGGAARARPCVFDWIATSPNSQQSFLGFGTNNVVTYWGGGVRGTCRGTTMVISGDSVEYFQANGLMHLIGHARYSEDSTTITSNLLRYQQSTAQVNGEGAVKIVMKNGTTVDADLAQYLRNVAPVRTYSAADANGHVRLVMRDSADVPDSAATVITSERLHMLRDTLFYAAKDVVITATDFIGTADSASTNSKTRRATLLGVRPQLKGRGDRKFTIDGNVLDIFGRERQIERLIAKGKAVAVSDSLNLSADTLDLRTTGTAIDRVEAWGGSRARALSPGRDISAMRLLISMPGQKLQDLRAYGKARAETAPDSTIDTKERDWIEGDSLTAFFDQTVAQKESSQPPMRSLVARGNARSFYQMKSEDKKCTEAAISYVTGRNIEVVFKTGQMNEVLVTGTVRGLNATPCKTVTDSVPPRRGGSE